MKKVLILLVAVVFFACGTSEKKSTNENAQAAEYLEATLNISGMHCNNCVNSIEKGINELEGIKTVTVTLEDSTAVVEYDKSKLALSDIEKAVQKRGFEVKQDN